MRRRISPALVGIAVSCAVVAAVWPHAREAGGLLAAQDDPAELSDLEVNSALRNNQKIISQNIEQALAGGDPDLAASFVELAREKNVPLADELSSRVAAAVAAENSTAGVAKRFTTGLVTFVVPQQRDMTQTIPSSRLNK